MTSLLAARDLEVEGRLAPTNLAVDSGSLAALIGPNGSGKTSLLRALAGIEPSARGIVEIADEELASMPPVRRMRLLSFLPATRSLVWPIPVRDVATLGLAKPDEGWVSQLLDRLDLAAFAGRPVNSLSTGERSRVLLARALAPRPRVLLLDEPLSNLDPYWALEVIDLLQEIVEEHDCAALVSVHDLGHVERFDRSLLMDGGTIACDGKPAEVLSSEALSQAFRIERRNGSWEIRPGEGRRSSP